MGVRIFAILLLALASLWWGAAKAEQANGLVPVQIKRILLVNDSPAVLLVDEPEHQFMLVFIDFFMANAIRMGMEKPVIERPLTHDLIGIFLRHLGAKVAKIAITGLKNNTYYALITLEVNGSTQEIDARPSDALALAVRLKAPIFASSALMKAVGGSGRKKKGGGGESGDGDTGDGNTEEGDTGEGGMEKKAFPPPARSGPKAST